MEGRSNEIGMMHEECSDLWGRTTRPFSDPHRQQNCGGTPRLCKLVSFIFMGTPSTVRINRNGPKGLDTHLYFEPPIEWLSDPVRTRPGTEDQKSVNSAKSFGVIRIRVQ
ncbi:unnamed protein product, partial [Nesidiocoris tenuis]